MYEEKLRAKKELDDMKTAKNREKRLRKKAKKMKQEKTDDSKK